MFCISLSVATAQDHTRPGCDSCRFKVSGLDQALPLTGNWLFTRDDSPYNKDQNTDTRDWPLVKAPGPWKTIYGDGRNFSVGWYRGTFEFAPSLIGQEVVLLLDPYMARVNVWLDEKEIYRRPDNMNVDRYYSIQPIPVRFKVTRPWHMVAVRVDTPIMTGIYQLPFELRRYDPRDLDLVWHQFHGGDLRLIAAMISIGFGLFFMLVSLKTHYGLYLFASLAGITSGFFFLVPTDPFLRIFAPEKLLYLHYLGLIFGYFMYRFSQYFHTFTPRLNWLSGLIFLSSSLAIGSMLIHADIDLFQRARTVQLMMLLLNGLGAMYMILHGVRNHRPGARVLAVGIFLMLFSGINDLLLALGRIDSYAMMPAGIFAFMSSMLYVASNIFANTFRQNKNLVVELTRLNDTLEEQVAERTRELGHANRELGAANANLRSSYEELKSAKDDLVRSEKLAALGSLVAGVAHELNTPIGNGLMASTTLRDQLNEFKSDMSKAGLRKSRFEMFLATVENAVDISIRSLSRSAELVTSFKQLAIDRTTAHRREFLLEEVVNDVLRVLQPTLKRTPYRIVTQIEGHHRLDSFPGPLGQVLTNFINNAILHGFDGRDQGEITISATLGAEGLLVLSVRDNGRGIPEDSRTRIFDPFFTTKLGQGGSGLGLHISHSVVTQVLGGTLTVSSEVGTGTEFVVAIPLVAPQKEGSTKL